MKILPTTIFYGLFLLVRSQESNEEHDSTSSQNISTTTQQTTTIFIDHFEYIVGLEHIFSNDKNVKYFIDQIYKNPTKLNITTADVVEFSKTSKLSLDETKDLFAIFGTNFETVFTVDNLETVLNITQTSFYYFYTEFITKMHLDGNTIMEILTALDIDLPEFSAAVAFGLSDVYDVLRKGNYSQERIEEAIQIAKTDKLKVFTEARNILFEEIIKNDLEYYGKVFKEHHFTNNDYYSFWNMLNVNNNDVLGVPKFRDIINEFHKRVNTVSLGVLTNPNQITIHKTVYNLFADFKDIVIINAKSLTADFMHENVSINSPSQGAFVKLLSNQNSTYVDVATGSPKNLQYCNYFSIVNNELKSEILEVYETNNSIITLKINLGTVFGLGNPIICEKKLYGFANEQKGYLLNFDLISAENLHSSAEQMFLNKYVLFSLFLLCILTKAG